jgi:exodeoxyribonuclease-3
MRLLLVCLVAFAGVAGAEKTAPDAIDIMTYNVLYGFDHGKTFKKGVKWIGEQEPDILALQEFRGFSEEKFASAARAWGHEYTALYKRPKGMPLAISAKAPVEVVETIDEGINRGILVAKAYGIHFVVIHLTSGSKTAGQVRNRMKEAAAVRECVSALLEKKESVVLLGDYNALSPLDSTQHDADGKTADYTVLQGFLDLGLVDVVHERLKGTEAIKGSFPSFLIEDRYPDNFNPRRLSRIDFILMSPDLAPRCESAVIHQEGVVNAISDHYPVVVRLRLKER